MLLKTVPLRDAALLRVLLAARLEADNRTGEIFGDDPAQRLREASGITRTATFDDAIAQAKKGGWLLGTRRYARGLRKLGGDMLNLVWSHWAEQRNTPCHSVSVGQGACHSVSECQQNTLSECHHIRITTKEDTAKTLDQTGPSPMGAAHPIGCTDNGGGVNPPHADINLDGVSSSAGHSSSRRSSPDASATNASATQVDATHRGDATKRGRARERVAGATQNGQAQKVTAPAKVAKQRKLGLPALERWQIESIPEWHQPKENRWGNEKPPIRYADMSVAHLRASAKHFAKHLAKGNLDGQEQIECTLRLFECNRRLIWRQAENEGMEQLHKSAKQLNQAWDDQAAKENAVVEEKDRQKAEHEARLKQRREHEHDFGDGLPYKIRGDVIERLEDRAGERRGEGIGSGTDTMAAISLAIKRVRAWHDAGGWDAKDPNKRPSRAQWEAFLTECLDEHLAAKAAKKAKEARW
jgi:hypothetical protein